MTRDVAVTGLGAVTALGPDVAALAEGLRTGRRAIGPLTRFAHGGRCQVAAEAPDPGTDGVADRLDRATVRRLSRPDRFALAVAREACAAAGLDDGRRAGTAVFVGASVGGMAEAEHAWRERRTGMHPRWRLSRLASMPVCTAAAVVAQALGLHGPRATFSTACSSSALAVAEAADAIRRGTCTTALVVGVDGLCRLTYAGFDALQALDPQGCRPFAADRAGLSLGDGAAALVLEDAAHARARGARPLARVLGAGTTTDAHHPTAPHPDGEGALRALRLALTAAGVAPDAVDYVNAHGTGTKQNDAMEIGVLRAGLGARLARVPVSSTKSQLGHTLAAAGAIEAVATVLALERGVLPPTAGLVGPEADWADVDLVPDAGRRAALGVALSSSYGFGGHNVTLVLGRAA